jgi:adenylate cyclase
LGDCEVKHGVRIGLVNLYTDEVGNSEMPLKLQSEAQHARRRSRTKWMLLAAAGLILMSLGAFFWWQAKRPLRTAQSAPVIAEKSIAVLPFENFSESKENEFFSDGISEEIINALTKVKALRVASRTSSFAFKGKNQDIGEVGAKLKVNTVLEGSVRKADNRLRVTVELVDVTSGYHLWSDRYDRKLADVFEIQDQIADNVVRALRVVLGETERRVVEKAPTENVEAYEYYLRGRQIQHQLRRSSLEYARRMFERAIEIDPNFARAHAGVADCCSFLYQYLDPSEANLETANASSQKALELDPTSGEAHTSRGLALTLRRDFREARREFDTALKLNPMLYEAHYFYARACFAEGRVEEAVTHYRDAARVRPEDYQAVFFSVQALMKLGRRDEAMEAVRQSLRLMDAHLDLNPDDARAWLLSAAALMRLNEREQALERARRALAIDPDDVLVQYNLACVYALAGLSNEALDHLDIAVQNGFRQRGWLENDSSLDSVRSDPRFEKIVASLAPK